MSSIEKELANLINPAPSLDPEDDIYEETRAKLVKKSELDEDDFTNAGLQLSTGFSSIKRLQPDDDPRYKGKVVSRDLCAWTDNFSVDSDDDYEGIDFRGQQMSEDGENEMSDNMEPDSDKEGDSDPEIDSDGADAAGDDDVSAPNIFNEDKIDKRSKGQHTKNQLTIWDTTLEARIKVQKLLLLANKFPRPDTYTKFMDQDDEGVTSALAAAKQALGDLRQTLSSFQFQLFQQTADVAQFQVDNEEPTMTSQALFDAAMCDRRAGKRCRILRQHRDRSLKLWYDKTRLATNSVNKKSSLESFERPTVEQIAHVMSDPDRLVARTRLKRSHYRVLGTCVDDEVNGRERDLHLKRGDSEVFDDDDFYHQLLRELIERKTNLHPRQQADSVNMTRQWLKLQRLNTKVKKVVDTKASKGRKIRYHVHPKLVSYMARCDRSDWTDDSINQLVKSMFGKLPLAHADHGDDAIRLFAS